MSVKFGGLKRLSKRLGDKARYDSFIDKTIRSLAAELIKILQKETPVGEYPAHYAMPWARESRVASKNLRKGWVGGQDITPVAYSKTLKIGNYSNTGYRVEIVNEVEYASMVNDGHRQNEGQNEGQYVTQIGLKLVNYWVEGVFFVEKSLVKFDSKSKPILQKFIERELRRIFK